MIDSILITTKWSNIFDWRYANVDSTQILSNIIEPCVCILSARSWGLKGLIPGARHSWISIYNKKKWLTFEVTDIETIEILKGNVIHSKYDNKQKLQLLESDRDPSLIWFGSTPRIEGIYNYFDIDFFDYPLNVNNNLVTNNCNTFISYIVWKHGLDFNKYYVGFKKKNFWDKNKGR